MSQASLHHQVSGPEHAPALVLLHALATHGELWRAQIPVWATRMRVITIDLPGHGRSPRIEGVLTLADHARQVALVLDDLGVQRAALVGLSLGGMVAQAYALAYPERCLALVLAHTSARTPEPLRAIWAQRCAQAAAQGLPAQVPSILERWFPPTFAQTSPWTLRWIAGQITSTSAEGYISAIRAIQGLDHLDRLHVVGAPTLVIAGELDAAAPPDAGARLAAQMPNARLVVLPGVAHLGNVQAPVLFTETVGTFLQTVVAH
ncbi:adhesin [Hylemonella gracilis str. Niagara R]|uniref:Adhesin n=1 Tax=Hylemonella gracilis str. Niagara R TaxID=1458275 RepID=A0A016XF66_9BURK|nr:alpha/beta fold hydrolase [Hylemonella gracilis]EYC50207.1 adhesin [Hylemonella gracilis str. Niagara R]